MPWSSDRGRPLVLAHRGASARCLENTAAAFAAARADGADGVELDVRPTGDRGTAVLHDADLVRVAGRPERVADLTEAELRRIALVDGSRALSLDDAIDLVAGMLVNVEIKVDGAVDAGWVAAVARRVADRLGDRAVVSSFRAAAVAVVRAAAPRVRAGLLVGAGAGYARRRGWPGPVLRPWSIHPHHDLVTADAMRRWRRRGWRVVTWTVDGATELRRLRRLGVDAVIANDPAAALRALAS